MCKLSEASGRWTSLDTSHDEWIMTAMARSKARAMCKAMAMCSARKSQCSLNPSLSVRRRAHSRPYCGRQVTSREARVARPQDFHPGQGSTALLRADPAAFPHDLVSGQGLINSVWWCSSSCGFVPREFHSASWSRLSPPACLHTLTRGLLEWTRVHLW